MVQAEASPVSLQLELWDDGQMSALQLPEAPQQHSQHDVSQQQQTRLGAHEQHDPHTEPTPDLARWTDMQCLPLTDLSDLQQQPHLSEPDTIGSPSQWSVLPEGGKTPALHATSSGQQQTTSPFMREGAMQSLKHQSSNTLPAWQPHRNSCGAANPNLLGEDAGRMAYHGELTVQDHDRLLNSAIPVSTASEFDEFFLSHQACAQEDLSLDTFADLVSSLTPWLPGIHIMPHYCHTEALLIRASTA